MAQHLRLGSVAGVPVRIHWSAALTFSLVAAGVATGILPESAPGYSTSVYWAAAAATAATFWACLLAHEISHVLVARRSGVSVRSMTLFVFGGVAELGEEPTSSDASLAVAAVGPATSIGVAAVFGASAALASGVDASPLLVACLGWLATFNLLLGVFNLLPGVPLDGGRLLQAALWRRSGDRLGSTVRAARAGESLGLALLVLGLGELVLLGDAGGLWLAFVGWFIRTTASAEGLQASVSISLEGLRVGDVMTPHPVVCPFDTSLSSFLDGYLLGGRHSAYPVTGRNGAAVGLMTLECVRGTPTAELAERTVYDAAVPLSDLTVAGAADRLVDVLARAKPGAGGRILVLDAGRVAGIVSPADVARTVTASELRPRPARARRDVRAA